jgi:curved DNA-binding protein CbpA
MEVLGLNAGRTLERDDVQRRFRRLVRLAHPDHGAEHDGAAERLAELSEARELLLDVIASAGARPAG